MNKLSACIAEAIGTFALIFIGIGAIHASPGLLGVALAHGLTIAVFVSATGESSTGRRVAIHRRRGRPTRSPARREIVRR